MAGELSTTITAQEDQSSVVSALKGCHVVCAELGGIIRFAAFQVVGAWANTGVLGVILLTCDSRAHRTAGMSLVDQNMVPFQTAYPLVIFLVICVLAGNTCLVSPIPIRMLGAADILSLRGQPILYVFSSSFS